MSPTLRLSRFFTLVAGAALGGLDALHLKTEKTPHSPVTESQLRSQRKNTLQASPHSATTSLSLPTVAPA